MRLDTSPSWYPYDERAFNLKRAKTELRFFDVFEVMTTVNLTNNSIIVISQLSLDQTTIGPVPNVFKDCADIVLEKDYKYAKCTGNLTAEQDACYMLKELHRAKEFRTYFLAVLPIILSVFAMILNSIYLFLQLRVYKKEGSSSRKRYIFLISRSLSTILALLLFYIVIICWKAGGFQYSSAMIFIFIGCLNFLSITGTYIGLTCLLYTAVVNPLTYKTRITLRYCYGIISLIWLCSVIAGVCVGLWGATLFYPETAPISCSYSKCRKPLAVIIVISLAICYSTVLIVYTFLLLRLKKRSMISAGGPKSSTHERQRASLIAMNRLGMNMATFAIGSIPILIVCVVALANLKQLRTLGEGAKTFCKTYLNSDLFVQVEILASVAAIVWLLAMILDPIINTIADRKLTSMLKNGWDKTKHSVKSWRSSRNTSVTQLQ